MSTTCKAEHHAIRSLRVVGWFARHAYALGIIAGSRTSYNYCPDHQRMTRLYWRGQRPYILGKSREWWRCLLKYHHIQGDIIGLGFCAKELPCPTCGSKTAGHLAGCRDAS